MVRRLERGRLGRRTFLALLLLLVDQLGVRLGRLHVRRHTGDLPLGQIVAPDVAIARNQRLDRGQVLLLGERFPESGFFVELEQVFHPFRAGVTEAEPRGRVHEFRKVAPFLQNPALQSLVEFLKLRRSVRVGGNSGELVQGLGAQAGEIMVVHMRRWHVPERDIDRIAQIGVHERVHALGAEGGVRASAIDEPLVKIRVGSARHVVQKQREQGALAVRQLPVSRPGQHDCTGLLFVAKRIFHVLDAPRRGRTKGRQLGFGHHGVTGHARFQAVELGVEARQRSRQIHVLRQRGNGSHVAQEVVLRVELPDVRRLEDAQRRRQSAGIE